MAATTDFDVWLDAVQLEDNPEEVRALYQAVRHLESVSPFAIQAATGPEGRWLVSVPHVSDPLLLASHEATKTFLRHLQNRHCDGMDVEMWCDFKHREAKDD